jgi:hypothetical protein
MRPAFSSSNERDGFKTWAGSWMVCETPSRRAEKRRKKHALSRQSTHHDLNESLNFDRVDKDPHRGALSCINRYWQPAEEASTSR